jgi:hypothetical protein
MLLFGGFLKHELDRYAKLTAPLLRMSSDEFVTQVADTAAVFERRGGSEQTKEASGTELQHMIENLKVLARAWMLEGIGFSVEEITELFQGTPEYSQQVALHSERGKTG